MSREFRRITGVDSVRLLAVIAVIVIHAAVFRDPVLENQMGQFNIFGVILNQLARFGVPFFFTVSGYFWGLKIHGGMPEVLVAKQTFKRILLILVFWSLVYLLPYNMASMLQYGPLGPLKVWYWHVRELAANPLLLLFESTSQHLWFLIALLWAVAISTAFIYLRVVKSLIAVAIGLYVFGILALAYSKTPVGLEIGFYTLTGPFFGTIFFVTGYMMSGWSPRESWFKIGVSLVVAGFAFHFAEVYWLWRDWQIRPIHHYVFGTWFIGVGVAMAALSKGSPFRSESMAGLGRLALGIYLIHPIFLENLVNLRVFLKNPLWDLVYVAVSLVLSIASVRAMSKHDFLSKVSI